VCFPLFFSFLAFWEGRAEGTRGACTVPPCAVCGQETDCTIVMI